MLFNWNRAMSMKKKPGEKTETRDESLRVSKRVRDQLKMAAAVLGRPLYDLTAEVMANYLTGLKLPDPNAARRARARKVT